MAAFRLPVCRPACLPCTALAAAPPVPDSAPLPCLTHLPLVGLQRWVRAALARPSLQQTTPSEEQVVSGMKKFVVAFKG